MPCNLYEYVLNLEGCVAQREEFVWERPPAQYSWLVDLPQLATAFEGYSAANF